MYCGSGHNSRGSGGVTVCSCPHHTVVCPEGLSQASTMESLSPVWKVPRMAHACRRVGIMLTVFEQALAKRPGN